MIEMIGSVAGFHLSASPVINGSTTLCAAHGSVIRRDGQVIYYNASSASISHVKAGSKKRLFMIDPLLCDFAQTESPQRRTLTLWCDEEIAVPGAFAGGLIVLGSVELVAFQPNVHQSIPDWQQRAEYCLQRCREGSKSWNKDAAEKFNVSVTTIKNDVARYKRAGLVRNTASALPKG